MAIKRLGFYAFEDYAKVFKSAASQFGRAPDDVD
jgi:hypothetical protein